MIASLYIKNFAIIDTLQVDFDDHMIALTGETGAGKSIIIEAIGQLIGNRTQTSAIQEGSESAFIEGVFSIANNPLVKEKLFFYEFDADDTMVVSKTIQRDGKSIIKLNYRTISLSVLKDIMPLLVDVHSQFETHSLFHEKKHLSILDQFIGLPVSTLLESYQKVYQSYKSIEKEYQTILQEELDDEQIDFYRARLSEIEEIDLDSVDEDALCKEVKQVEDYEKLHANITLYQNYMEDSVFLNLRQALDILDTIKNKEEYNTAYDSLYNMYYQMQDLHEQIISMSTIDGLDVYDSTEKQKLLHTLQALKKRYGPSLEAVIEQRNTYRMKIDRYEKRDSILSDIKAKMEVTKQKLIQSAKKITALRKKEAKRFTSLIQQELKKLYLPNVDFTIQFTNIEGNITGQDQVVFLISTNHNALLPIHKIASGGELSRIMLAIKSVCMQTNGVSTIIFDEVDTGVSGRVAESMGSKMHAMSKDRQVLCITHLPQVASKAEHHYAIEKKVKKNKVVVSIKKLNKEQSIEELAKMMSGKEITEQSLEHARNLKLKK